MNPCDVLSHIEKINTHVIKPIKPHVDRALRKRQYREALKKKVEDLAIKHEKLKVLVEDARRETREIDPQVDLWQTKVETRIAKDGLILDEYERLAQQRCFIICPNFATRYQLNYKAEAEVTTVDELLKEAAGYDAVEKISRLPHRIAERPPIVVGDYESFQSREIIIQQVIDDLTVSGKGKLGVYGMGGSGKTTLVKVVAGKVMEKKSFDFVVLCKVTAVQNIATIQKEIMEKLGLEIKEENPDARATRLLGALEKMLKEKKRILFVLDDLWNKLKLEAVGIPSPDQHKGCQILMTSRKRQVLSTEMGCDDNVIDIGLLSEDEARELFMKMSANNFENNDDLRSKADEVARACARLPIAIVTVARALKNNTNLSAWSNALLDLKRPSPANFSKVREDDPAIEEDVHKSIYLSYKLLASDELRSTLLLCSQLLNNSSVRDLLRYSWSLRLLPENRVRNVEEAQNMLRSLVGQLQASCLLLDTGSNERIALHDVVRVITQAIASEEHHVFTRRPEDDELTALPEDKKCTRMWLRCKIGKLPEKLGYRELELFHMDNASGDLKVPDSIFKLKGRQRLKVLSLTNFSFRPSLPSSLQSLKENLQTLCLDGSSLEDTAIVIIGVLENLEILSFAKCKIRRLPKEIGKLKKLKILDLSDCYGLEVPRDVIGRLHRLEELYMGDSFSDWENERGAEASLAEGKEGAKASLAEVRMLHLSNLEIVIPNAGVMVENLFSEGLKRYRVTIGSDEWWDESYETLSKLLRISLDTNIRFDFYGIQMLLSSAEVLCLGRMKGVKDVLSEGFPQLKHLKLENFETQYVVDAAKNDPSKAFPVLESLLLDNLDSLEEICHGEFTSQPFPSFVAIEVRDCPNLKNLFSFSIARGLSQLKSIDVRRCQSLEGIVGEEDEATDDKIEFSELRSMVLCDLPQLKKFCYKMQEAPNSSGETSLKQSSLFDQTTLFPKLEELQLESIHMETIWHGPFEAVKSSIQNLRRLSVENCDSLKYLFTSSMVGCLAQLEYLSVRDCAKMEEIILTEDSFIGEEGRINENVILFSKLDALYLWALPNLKRFCTASLLECPRLTNINLYKCHALKTFVFNSCFENKTFVFDAKHDEEDSEETLQEKNQPLFGKKVSFPNLAEMEIDNMDNLEQIWHDQLYDDSFCALRKMEIARCKRLFNVLTFGIWSNFKKLQELSVMGCHALEEIFDLHGLHVEGTSHICNKDPQGTLQFENLSVLKVYNCNSLKNIVTPSMATGLQKYKTLFPKLEELQLESINIKTIWHGPFEAVKSSIQNLRRLSVENCNSLEYLFTSSMVGCLAQLEYLSVQRCAKMEEIILTEEAFLGKEGRINENVIVFSKLDALKIWKLPKLKRFCTASLLECPRLTNIKLWKCHALKTFVFNGKHDEEDSEQTRHEKNQPLFDETVSFPNLAEMEINHMANLEKIWHDQLYGGSFCALRKMGIGNCERLLNVFTFGICSNFKRLEELSVITCHAIEEIFDLHGLHVEGRGDVVNFQLRDIYLNDLRKLRHIWNKDPEGILSFRNLQSLRPRDCPVLKNIFPSSIAKDLMQLEDLKIEDCAAVEENDHPENKIPQSVIRRKRDIQLGKGMPNLKELEPSSASFQNLATLEVYRCNGMLSLMSTAAAKSLVHLKELSVMRCERVSEIVSLHDGETKDVIAFSKLELLRFARLENLTGFCLGNCNFMFPSLEKVIVQGCPRLSIFSPGHSHTMKLKGVQWGENDEKDIVELKVDLNNTIQHLFKEMMGYCVMEELKLAEFPELRGIWNSQLRVEVFKNLSSLVVDQCQSFAIAVPSKLLPVLNDLGELDVRNCSFLRGIFDLENLKDDESHVLLPQLSLLSLSDLPRLSHICNKDPQGTLQFKNLNVLKVDNCSSLKNIFTPSMAMGLEKLEKMEIRNCSSIEEIISTAETGQEASTGNIRFPYLKNIILVSLPNLTGIYSGSHILEFPSLKGITIANCPKMNAVLSSILGEPEPETSDEDKGKGEIDLPSSSASLLNNKVDFPCLNMLGVDCNNTICMESSQAAPQFSDKIKVLEFVHSNNDRFVFPSQFLQRLPNIGTVTVRDAFIKEIVPQEVTTCDGEEKHTEVLALKRLKLSNLPNLRHLSNEESQPWLLFQNLERLMVLECGRLKMLASSSVSFQSLTTLLVSKCHGLIHLLTSSTAKSLVQLRIMWITKCRMIEEIIANEETEAGGEFNFSRLKVLVLYDLPNLKSFCSGKNAFAFPSLKEVLVIDCPQMKTFSLGVVNTPKLKRVRFPVLEKDEEDEDEKVIANLFEKEEEEEEEVEEDSYRDEGPDDGYWQGSLNATLGEMCNVMDQAGPREKLPFSTNKPTSNIQTAKGEDDLPLVASQEEALKDLSAPENPAFNKDLHQEIETTFEVIIEEQARKDPLNRPETAQNVSTDIFSSAISNDMDPTPRQISSALESQEPNGSVLVQKDPQATADNEPVKHQAIASPVSACVTAEQAPMSVSVHPSKTTSHPTSEASSASVVKSLSSPTDFESLFASIEKLLHSSPASTFRSALAKSNDSSDDAISDSSSGSVDMLKKILAKTTAEVDDGLLSRPTLENLKKQVERTVIELSIEDGRKEIAMLKSLYEGSTAKISNLDADEEELEKRLKEIREEKYQVQANIQDLYEKLVERKGELDQSMDALREATRECKERGSRSDDN